MLMKYDLSLSFPLQIPLHRPVSAEQRIRAGTECRRHRACEQEARERLVPRNASAHRQEWPLPGLLRGASGLIHFDIYKRRRLIPGWY